MSELDDLDELQKQLAIGIELTKNISPRSKVEFYAAMNSKHKLRVFAGGRNRKQRITLAKVNLKD